jgi:glycosyltransferase involved in cell wall biosynthesis
MRADEARPLVTIGIPTYNRSKSLVRAVESARAQDHAALEIVVSDNASTDETEAVCRELAARDARVRVIRHAANRGATANFRAAFEAAHGELFMWLADDDWLDPSYVSRCASTLVDDPASALVCGRDLYHAEGAAVQEGVPIDLEEPTGPRRLVSYYRQVALNGAYYGLMRRALLARVAIEDTLGGDWLIVAAMAFFGKVRTLRDVSLHRATGGVSRSWESLASYYKLEGFWREQPTLAIARTVFADIGWKSNVYASLDRARRLALAAEAASVIVRRNYSPGHAIAIARQLARGGWGPRIP